MFFGNWKKQQKINNQLMQQMKNFDEKLENSFSNVRQDVTHVNQWINYLHSVQDKLPGEIGALNSRMNDFAVLLEEFLTKDDIREFVDLYYAYLDRLHGYVTNMNSDLSKKVVWLHNSQQSVFQRLEAVSKAQEDLKVSLIEDINEKFDEKTADFDEKLSNLAEKSSVFERLDALNKRMDDMYANIGKTAPAAAAAKPAPRSNLKEKIFKKVTRHSKEYVRSMLISLIKKYQKITALNLREIVVEEQGIVSKSSLYRLLVEIEEEEGIHVVQEGKEKLYIWALNSTPNVQ